MANGTHLLRVDLKSKSVSVLQSTGGDVISIHFDATSSRVFICHNKTTGRIVLTGTVLSPNSKSKLSLSRWPGVNAGDSMKVIVNSTAKLLACAVDWARQKLYWIDSVIQGKGHLMRSDFSGGHSKSIHEDNDFKKVRSMVIDPSVTDRT